MASEDLRRRLQQLHDDLQQLVAADSEQEVLGAALSLMDQLVTEARSYLPQPLRDQLRDFVTPELIAASNAVRAADAVVITGQMLSSLPAVTTPSPSEELSPPPPDPSGDGADPVAKSSTAADSALKAAFDAVDAHKPEDVVSALAEWVKEGNDELSTVHRQSVVASLRFQAGDTNAFEEIHDRAYRKESRDELTIRHYAQALKVLGEEASAAREVEVLSNGLPSDVQAELRLLVAKLLQDAGREGDANNKLMALAVDSDAPDSIRSRALKELAAHLGRECNVVSGLPRDGSRADAARPTLAFRHGLRLLSKRAARCRSISL
ncbi:hypothetical protein [Jatrophihabitans sp.]|jgi:hypothetical protein|uniref:hypothetical protein n=1 Tax=Jatrophihabitans sp. TaxID=1932789 RepID=UPI002EF2C999